MDRVIGRYPSEDIGGGLRWCEPLGLAFQGDQTRSVAYDADYFAKHAAYEGSPINDRINAARVEMVQSRPSRVLDVGIGSGTFLTKCQEHGIGVLGGCDVNPAAVAWLESRGLFVDPYQRELPDEPITWTLWDVLEHLRSPHDLLDRIRVGDSLCMTVPIFHDLRREVFGSKHFRPDEHYYYVTPAGLIRWLSYYRLRLVSSNSLEADAGRESVASFVFEKVAPLDEPIPPRRAFIVCGPESSGNRVLGAILCRAGCWGNGSTEQPTIEQIPADADNVMLIRHHDLLQTFRALKARGFEPTAILTVREWTANLKSLVMRGHDASELAAEDRLRRTLLSNLCDAVTYHIPLIVTTYESLNRGSIRALLERLQLRIDNLDQPLDLRGQETPDQTFQPNPLAANAKHY